MRQPPDPSDRPALLGRRVVVRYRLQDQEFTATDVLGRLESWSGGVLRVVSDRGEPVDVDESEVVAVKEIPARTVTRREVRDLEAAVVQGWQATETAAIGGWLLRASGGFSRRANSCIPLDDPGRPVAEAVAEVVRWYQERDLNPSFQVPEPLGRVLDPHLDAHGWPGPRNRTVVMTAPAAEIAARLRPDLPDVPVSAEPDDAWLANYHYDGEELPPDAMPVLVKADPVGFASVDDESGRVAIARAAVSEAPSGRRWVGFTAVEVEPRARRRGLGTHVVAALAAWAIRHGATDAYLQVAAENAQAFAVYERLGFAEHHRYHYRLLPR